jgi:3-deoxy-manno-octulosonate cytidylyltransferase (CMP-KDO synthetase)
VIHTELNPQIQAVVVIPARYASTRLPGKPLLEIGSKPMIVHVVERALGARNVSRAIVATDDKRIFAVVADAGYEAVMTSAEHQCGSDRLAEVALQLDDVELLVNVQGDEPLISSLTIERVVDELLARPDAGMVSVYEPMSSVDDVLNPDVVKVVVDDSNRAIYFSRSPIPYPREAVRRNGDLKAALKNEPELLATFRKHTGIYGYRRRVLLEFKGWPASKLEKSESLEQLRALEHGVSLFMVEAAGPSLGVDTIEDLQKVKDVFPGLEVSRSSEV